MIWEIFNDVFWISIATLTFSFFGVVIKAMLSSKCDNVNICFGLLKIHRRVELESAEPTNQPNQNLV
jgi:hypothetical protein